MRYGSAVLAAITASLQSSKTIIIFVRLTFVYTREFETPAAPAKFHYTRLTLHTNTHILTHMPTRARELT